MTAYQSTTLQELEEEHQTAISEAQTIMMKELEEAQLTGDMDKIRVSSSDFQKKTSQLVTLYQEKIEEINARGEVDTSLEDKVYGNTRSGLILDNLVYEGDKEYVLAFQKDNQIQKVLETIESNNPVFKSRRHLLKSSLRLTKTLAPQLHEIGTHCKEILKLKNNIEFFVYQSDVFNASCYPPDDNTLYIILSSGILERFQKDELSFVVGHEIGHVLFEHFKYPVKHILEEGRDTLAPIHAMKLYAWNRNAEISADRAGLLCCQSFEAAGRTFFKLSSGVTTDSLDFQLSEYLQQFVDLESVLNDAGHDPSDWYSSHPFSPIRIKALELFNKSETYKKFNNACTVEITGETMESEIKRVMSLMEPQHLNEGAEYTHKIQRFMFLGGYLIANADGTIEESEIQALSSIVDASIFAECMLTIQGLEEKEMIGELGALAKELDVVLSVMQKLNILRDLSIITYADGAIDDSEVKVLYTLAVMLYINTEFIDRVISDAQGIE